MWTHLLISNSNNLVYVIIRILLNDRTQDAHAVRCSLLRQYLYLYCERLNWKYPRYFRHRFVITGVDRLQCRASKIMPENFQAKSWRIFLGVHFCFHTHQSIILWLYDVTFKPCSLHPDRKVWKPVLDAIAKISAPMLWDCQQDVSKLAENKPANGRRWPISWNAT